MKRIFLALEEVMRLCFDQAKIPAIEGSATCWHAYASLERPFVASAVHGVIRSRHGHGTVLENPH